MLKEGIINGQLASVLARFRHVNTLAIVDGPFPSYPNVELVDLALVKGFPITPINTRFSPDASSLALARAWSKLVSNLGIQVIT